MALFRIEGTSITGKPVISIVDAENYKKAKERAKLFAQQKGFKVTSVSTRHTFVYRVRCENNMLVVGEQRAFSKQQVFEALRKMGFTVVQVNRKLLDF